MRRMRPRLLGILLASGVLVVAAGALVARAAHHDDGPCPGTDANTLPITLAQAQSIALAQVAGAVWELKLDCENGRTTYEMEVQPQAGGRQMKVEIDAATGSVLKIEAD
jgi:uncharacterized membrane protein YkoI